ncbi:hypothetical protein KFK09_016320 [Dendrobium nobile]|uniref:F-box domain-containing protein n=1 Tax=Dendrobium nobile TaxID=94219 RepID=A0A8T3B4F5_DENNO|nr:hypothetical protein KFK09_016320 [Dendrobium nobile]
MKKEERKWEDLASDCLVCIFCFVGLEELTVALPFVCKSWYEASLDRRCWKNLDFRELDFSSGSNFARIFRQEYGVRRSSFSFSAFMKMCVSRSCGSAVELTIPYIVGASIQQDLIYASIKCPRLKVLALPSLLEKDEKKLPELISKWKELEILEITWKPNSFLEILEQIRVNCPNFIGLHLCGLFDIMETWTIVRCMPRLKILVMSASYLCKEDLMEILDGCKELEVFDVSKCRGFVVDNEILKKASKIKKFECGDCKLEQNYTNFYYDYYGLEELTIVLPFVCKSWYEASLDPQCWKKLDFQGFDFSFRRKFERRFDRQTGFMSATFSFPSFMKLCVDRSRGSAVEVSIPDFGSALSLQNLITASIGCPRLKVLSFSGVLQQYEKHLPELISKWKELEILKIAQKPFSILEIFEQISINCPNFRGLHLYGLFNTTETRAIVRCMPRLKILVISGSVIFKENMMEILDGCKELEKLNVSYCAGFDVDNEILKKASKIKKFECEGTTSEGTMIHDSLLERSRIARKYSQWM